MDLALIDVGDTVPGRRHVIARTNCLITQLLQLLHLLRSKVRCSCIYVYVNMYIYICVYVYIYIYIYIYISVVKSGVPSSRHDVCSPRFQLIVSAKSQYSIV